MWPVRGVCAVIAALLAATVLAAGACGRDTVEPLRLDGRLLTVDNRTPQDWRDVTIELNSYFQARTRSIPAHSRFQAPLDVFVTGFGQRFDFARMQIRSVRLTATLPDGRRLELNKPFERDGLAAALGGK